MNAELVPYDGPVENVAVYNTYADGRRLHFDVFIPTAERDVALLPSTLDAEALLRRLDPAIAELIALRVIVGLSNAEISRLTGRSEGAIRVATHRGLSHLRNLIESPTSLHVSVTDPMPATMDQS